jgi:anti-anti-sigma factor
MMGESFSSDRDAELMVIKVLRNSSSLAEVEVRAESDLIKQELKGAGVTGLVFDLTHVDYFGSAMLESMLGFWKSIGSPDHRVAVCGASKTAKEILKVSRFDTLWKIKETLPDALVSLREQAN